MPKPDPLDTTLTLRTVLDILDAIALQYPGNKETGFDSGSPESRYNAGGRGAIWDAFVQVIEASRVNPKDCGL